MEHEIYLALIEHDGRLAAIEEALVKKMILPKPKEEVEEEPKEPETEEEKPKKRGRKPKF